jgi:very-short-patch-repair endonuclease
MTRTTRLRQSGPRKEAPRAGPPISSPAVLRHDAERQHPLTVALEAAGRQHGAVARRQLLEAGLSTHSIDGLVARRFLRVLHRGVYQVGPIVGPHFREMAAVLACGSGAVISHRSAGTVWKLLVGLPNDAPVDVMVPARDRGARPGIRAHRVRRLDPGEVTAVDGVPVTTPARTLLDLAGQLRAQELERAVARAERYELLQRAELLRMVRKHPRRPGNPILARLAGSTEPIAFIRSEAEALFLDRIRDAELPTPRVNVRVRGFEVDCFWPAARLIVEVDGFAYHGSASAFERDRRRDGILTVAGYRVIRVTWHELTTRPGAVIARVAQALVPR